MITLSLENVLKDAGVNNPTLLITREKGQKVYSELQKQILSIKKSNSPLILLFPENQLMDVSFADEVIIRVGEELVQGVFGDDQGLLLRGLGDDSIKNLNAAIRLQKLKIAFLTIKPNEEWDCVGQLEQNLRDTLDLVYQKENLTAPDLVKQLGLAVNTASTRLKRLYDLHLVKRDFEITENGLQYTYHFWPVKESAHD